MSGSKDLPERQAVRIDKWLWAVRVFKTRSVAADACRRGHVRLDDEPVKPSREVRAGDTLKVRAGDITRTVRVRGLIENRVGASLVPQYMEDLTPPEERARPRDPVLTAWRPPGSGRPTKRERRRLQAWLGHAPGTID